MEKIKAFLNTTLGKLVVIAVVFVAALGGLAFAFPEQFDQATGGVLSNVLPGGQGKIENVLEDFAKIKGVEVEYIPPVASKYIEVRAISNNAEDAYSKFTLKLKKLNIMGYSGDISIEEIAGRKEVFLKLNLSNPEVVEQLLLQQLGGRKMDPRALAYIKNTPPYSYIFEVLEGKKWIKMDTESLAGMASSSSKLPSKPIKLSEEESKRLMEMFARALVVKQVSHEDCCTKYKLGLDRQKLIESLKELKEDPIASKFEQSYGNFKKTLDHMISELSKASDSDFENTTIVLGVKKQGGHFVPVMMRFYVALNQKAVDNLRKSLAPEKIAELEKQVGKELASELKNYLNRAVSERRMDLGEIRFSNVNNVPQITPPSNFVDAKDLMQGLR